MCVTQYLTFAHFKIGKQISSCRRSSVHFDEIGILSETFLVGKLKLIQGEHVTWYRVPSYHRKYSNI